MRVIDRTGNYCCPSCGGKHAFHYEEIPEHRRHYVEQNGDQTVEHMPAIRDYECSDCGWRWSQDPTQERFHDRFYRND